MHTYYFTFGSVTHAQHAVRVLDQHQVPNQMLRTPKELQMQGCGYSVTVRSGYFYPAVEALDRGKCQYRRIYCRMPDGTYTEVRR